MKGGSVKCSQNEKLSEYVKKGGGFTCFEGWGFDFLNFFRLNLSCNPVVFSAVTGHDSGSATVANRKNRNTVPRPGGELRSGRFILPTCRRDLCYDHFIHNKEGRSMNENIAIEIQAFNHWLLNDAKFSEKQNEALRQSHQEALERVGPLFAIESLELERSLTSASSDFVNAYLSYREVDI